MDGHGTLTLRLECRRSLPEIRGHAGSTGPFVAVAVIDQGTGIGAAELPHIFEPFFTTKEVGKGTGLGLSQVIGFAKQSGGDVDVASAPGRGTTFTLYLPQVEPPAAEGPDERREGGDGRVLRILVVEDNLDVGRFCTQILEELGHSTVWAKNGEEALAEVERDPDGFDAVFSDVVMPGMGGIAMAHRVRTMLPDLPIILTSGYSDVLAREGTHGFDLVRKPYSAAQVAEAFRSVPQRPRPPGD
jgi:CheY-like chemotaxis protein